MGVVGDATVIRLRLSSDDVVDELHYSTASGYILDGDDAGVVNAVVELTGDDYDAKVTDSNGYYQFPEVLNGNYTLTPAKNGKTYYADHQDIAVAGDDVLVGTMIEVWVVSGYIVDEFDAGIEDVTVALSGDESGSTTTDVHGFYSFSNIPNGSYTVTPAKADLEFTPDHQDITVVDADEVVTDMVGDSIHYTISGYILDGDSAGIEGVTVTDTPLWAVAGVLLDAASDPVVGATVTLSGDASDTDTTDANGAYSFLLPDGSYTITPTFSGYAFTEDHEDVTVDGDDVVVDTMVGESIYLALPYTYNMSDVVPSSGAVAGQLADWDVWTTLDDGTITTSIADLNSYSPSGVTKAFSVAWGVSRGGVVNNIGLEVDPSLTSIRIAVLFRCSQANRYPQFFARDSLGTPLSLVSVFASGNASPDLAYTSARYEDAFSINEMGGESLGGNYETRWWHWLRGEWNFVTEEVIMSLYRVETASTIWTKTVSMYAAGVTLGHVPSGMDRLAILATEANTTAILAKYWIGTASDAWPT